MQAKVFLTAIFAGATALGAASAIAAEPVPAIARAEACLRANVDRVVGMEADLLSAGSFLVSYICAEETARAAKYERNTAWLISMRGFVKASNQMSPNLSFGSDIDATVDPATGEFVIPPPKPGAPPNMMTSMLASMSSTSAIMMPDAPSSSLRKLAGDLVLAARERRVAAGR